MKRLIFILGLGLLALVRPAFAAPTELDARLREPAFQYELLRYVYHWYLDDRFFVETAKATSFEVWFRPLPVRDPDPGDHSLYAEFWLPAAQIQLRLKLADYTVPELSRHVKSPGFRVTRAAPLPAAPAPREAYTVFTLDREKIFSYLYDARHRPHAPDAALRERLLGAMRSVVKQHPPANPTATQIFFLSNVSPVSGDLWILWVNEHSVIRFGGEFGADAPDLLTLLPLHTQLYDLKKQVVASLLETEGSTGFITKDWAGRILFQCLVQGERVDVSPASLGLGP